VRVKLPELEALNLHEEDVDEAEAQRRAAEEEEARKAAEK